MSLNKYVKKRKFDKTPEPKGKKVGSKSKLPIFVVHRHDARQLHFDLRLEQEGTLKSWAVPKGPSFDPKDRRLAVHVEDHPMDYASFKGKIPEGNYGAGEVEIWDEGTFYHFKSKEKTKAEIEKLFKEGESKGHIHLVFDGHKLKGEYSLIKFPSGDTDTWLLIKGDDKFANKPYPPELTKKPKEVHDEKKKKPSKDLDKVLEDYKTTKSQIKFPVKPMLAELIDAPFNDEDWIFEIKYDGYRAVSNVKDGEVVIWSRNGKDFTEKFAPISTTLLSFDFNCILDGEVVVLNDEGVPEFSLIKNYSEEDASRLVYYVFDILELNGKDLTKLELIERKKILKEVLPKTKNIIYSDHINKLGIKFFEVASKQGLEGVVGKKKTGKYLPGERNGDWVKIKSNKSQECIIVGFTEPQGSRKYFGSLALAIYKDKKLTYVGNVGSGFNENDVKEIYEKIEKSVLKEQPFDEKVKTKYQITWVKPKLVCEVKYSEFTSDGMMRHPVFLRIRDKNPEEITLETAKDESILRAPTEEKETLEIDGNKLELSNLQKIYWPKDGLKKRDLINYYLKISDFILPYMKDRPLSLNRHPNGIKGENFYQKDIRHEPDWATTIDIYSGVADRSIHYIVGGSKSTLIYLANLGCIEFNPWNSTIKHLDRPDYLIIDLDPHEIEFDKVVEAAQVTRKLLEELEIPSYPKTSGLYGMHIHVPLGAKYNYDQVREFTEILVNLIHQRIPDFTSVVRDPDKRHGKIYLDFLQNRKAQTIASVYSLRPKDGAPVSTPLKWSEVTKKLTPGQYTMKNIFKRLDKVGDLFTPVLGKGIDIEKALKRIEKLQKKSK